MIIFLDTETTGLPNDRMPPDDPSQPHLVQLAMLLTEKDGTERASVNLIVNPCVSIPDGASRVHGITNEIAERCGVLNPVACAMWNRLAERASMIVAHNIKFDLRVMEIAWGRATARPMPLNSLDRFCTMEASAPLVGLPPTERMLKAGLSRPKSPKLSECFSFFFGEDLDGAHDALVDVRACARVFFHIRSMEPAL